MRRGDSKSQNLIYNSKVGFPSLKVLPQLKLGHVQVPSVNKDIAQDANETEKKEIQPLTKKRLTD